MREAPAFAPDAPAPWRLPVIDRELGRVAIRMWRRWCNAVSRGGLGCLSSVAVGYPATTAPTQDEPLPGERSASMLRLALATTRLTLLIEPLCGSVARPIADRLLARFGSLPALLRADRKSLTQHLLGHEDLVDLLLAIRPLAEEMLLAEMVDRPLLPDNRAVIRYLHATMAHEPAEHVRMLYLDAKNRLLLDEVATRGTVTRTDISPREIVRRALDVGATGMIMAHNHPSGDPQPSRHDLAATRAVAEAARLFEMGLHDHIIISRTGYRSLREEGYL